MRNILRKQIAIYMLFLLVLACRHGVLNHGMTDVVFCYHQHKVLGEASITACSSTMGLGPMSWALVAMII